MNARVLMSTTAALAVLGLSTAAYAQDYNRGRNVSVSERQRADYQALGLRRGAFLVLPEVETTVSYAGNVLGSATNKTSDLYFDLNPSVAAKSTWSRHELDGEIGAKLRRYGSEDTENRDGWFARLNGRVDVHGESYLQAGADATRDYEARTAPGSSPLAKEVISYVSSGAYGRGVYQAGRIRAKVGADFRHFEYDNVARVGGGILNLSDRDRDVVSTDVRGDYAVSPDTALFLRAAHTKTDYSAAVSAGGQNRDSTENYGGVGANFDLTALMRGEFELGYVSRDYKSGLYGSIEGLSAAGQVEYFPTQLTTVTFSARRSIEDSVNITSGGYFVTGGGIRIDHELRRNVLLHGLVDYEVDAYNGVDRKDKIWNVSTSLEYLVSRSVGWGVNLAYFDRSSQGLVAFRGASLDDYRISLGLKLQR